MKLTAVLLIAALLAGCTSKTEFGDCIGIADDKKPDLQYKVSAWNVFLAIIFVETIFVPIMVLSDNTSCPVAKKVP